MTLGTIELFQELEKRFRHPFRGKKNTQESLNYRRSQLELYHLAQALAPQGVQERLDAARRATVAALFKIPRGKHKRLMPRRTRAPMRWYEFMLTPELEGDLALSHRTVEHNLAKELQEAHRVQIKEIKRIVGIL